MIILEQAAQERFWNKVNKTESCWNWTSATNGFGYGLFWSFGKMVTAHRFSYELARGPIPKGLTLDHLCRNTICVNPDHLEPVTMRENILRGQSPTAINARKSYCVNGHELTDENLIKMKLLQYGCRCCKICQRTYNNKYQKRERSK